MRARAMAWRDLLASAEERSFTRNGVSATILDAEAAAAPHPLLGPDFGGWAIVLHMRCERDGRVLRRADEPWVICNPPYLVPDGMDAHGRQVFREDVREALRVAVIDFLRGKHGG